MRLSPSVEEYRITKGRFATEPGARYGMFRVYFRARELLVMACEAAEEPMDWDHVSVSVKGRCPNWEEMSHVKSLFFGDDETVVQFHPKRSEHINCHPYCLHLWRKAGVDHELPPSIMVGPSALVDQVDQIVLTGSL